MVITQNLTTLSHWMRMAFTNVSPSLGPCNGHCHWGDLTLPVPHWVASRRGHLELFKQICGHLMKMQNFAIHFRTCEPDFSNCESIKQDWFSICSDGKESLPANAPELLRKPVQLVNCVDTNMMHDALINSMLTLHQFDSH